MSDDFIGLFRQEYAALMQLAGDLPPDVARRLRISRDRISDPHVERLLEGVAYLGARVHARLDDEFPELTDGLLNILYPQMLAPFPSCMMVRLVPKADLQRIARIDAFAPLRTPKTAGTSCSFRTASAVALWPVAIDAVQLTGRPLPLPENPGARDAAGVLRISLRCLDRAMSFARLARDEAAGLGPLRVQCLGGTTALSLHKMICNHAVSVCFADVPGGGLIDQHPLVRGADGVTAGGMKPHDALIPWPAHGFSGYRLLSEYFALPEKFLCFDLQGIGDKAASVAGNRLDILIYLNEVPSDLERAVDATHLALGCVPAVNLFSRRCEPIDLDWSRTEYRVDADRANQAGTEVWAIEEVRETRADGSSQEWQRLFRQGAREADEGSASYMPLTRPAAGGIGGTETFLAIDAPDADPASRPRSRLSVRALCTNRDVPSGLPFGRDGTPLEPETGIAGVERIVSMTAPTATLRPPARGLRAWLFISHLSLSHLSITGGEPGAETLRELLALYDLRRTAETKAAIAALVSVTSTDAVARLQGTRPGVFCRGTDITLTFMPPSWRGGSFLLASVLEQFLRLHATVNGFVRTIVKLQGQPDPVARWPARSGTRELL
jgi:type VI secretion system protein ImpG